MARKNKKEIAGKNKEKMAGKNNLFGLMTNLSSTADFSSDVLVSMLGNFFSASMKLENIVGPK